MAAYYLGMRTLYLEAGSGSNKTISPEVIAAVRAYYPGLLIVGGGVTSPEAARTIAKAGADVIVVGNLLEKEGFEAKLAAIVKAIK
jgi:geranylgeranylglyceryl phosphate synthase family protein